MSDQTPAPSARSIIYDTVGKAGLTQHRAQSAEITMAEANSQNDKLVTEAAARINQLLTERAIAEQQNIIDSINENKSDIYPKIVETDVLTYVSHGHAVACKQIKRNAVVRIRELRAALKDGGKDVKE